jgi:hypothetical protein
MPGIGSDMSAAPVPGGDEANGPQAKRRAAAVRRRHGVRTTPEYNYAPVPRYGPRVEHTEACPQET